MTSSAFILFIAKLVNRKRLIVVFVNSNVVALAIFLKVRRSVIFPPLIKYVHIRHPRLLELM